MSEPHPEPAREVLGWLLGGGGLVALGGGLKWLWDKLTGLKDSREKRLEAREAELEERIAERLQQLEGEVKTLKAEAARNRLVIGILVAKVARDDPTAPELRQVEKILTDTFPVDVGVPGEMLATLAALDAAAAGGSSRGVRSTTRRKRGGSE